MAAIDLANTYPLTPEAAARFAVALSALCRVHGTQLWCDGPLLLTGAHDPVSYAATEGTFGRSFIIEPR